MSKSAIDSAIFLGIGTFPIHDMATKWAVCDLAMSPQNGRSSDPHWMAVSTPLKNMSQLGWLFPIYGKIIQSCSSHHQPESRFPRLGPRLVMDRKDSCPAVSQIWSLTTRQPRGFGATWNDHPLHEIRNFMGFYSDWMDFYGFLHWFNGIYSGI